jgi:DNA mismatch repair ATPase MutL
MNLIVEDGCYDINVSPDKREVFLKDEAELISAFHTFLTQWFEQI